MLFEDLPPLWIGSALAGLDARLAPNRPLFAISVVVATCRGGSV
jgi:hypothetical protein